MRVLSSGMGDSELRIRVGFSSTATELLQALLKGVPVFSHNGDCAKCGDCGNCSVCSKCEDCGKCIKCAGIGPSLPLGDPEPGIAPTI